MSMDGLTDRVSVPSFGGHGSMGRLQAPTEAGAVGGSRLPLFPECPFCLWRGDRMVDHVTGCHPERLVAAAAYQQALDAGTDLEVARLAYNETVRRALETSIGRYERRSA